MFLTKRNKEIADPEPTTMGPESLDAWFARAARVGTVDMFQYDDGSWSVRIKMATDNPAVRADVHSGYRHPTPHAAIAACLRKLERGEG